MILAQAAARAYPDRYRPLGGTVGASDAPPASITEAIQAYKDRTGTS